tara:strand:+ start:1243 stop:1773 length:531 start_codon:yes stop_codon:yes gene_type:complete
MAEWVSGRARQDNLRVEEGSSIPQRERRTLQLQLLLPPLRLLHVGLELVAGLLGGGEVAVHPRRVLPLLAQLRARQLQFDNRRVDLSLQLGRVLLRALLEVREARRRVLARLLHRLVPRLELLERVRRDHQLALAAQQARLLLAEPGPLHHPDPAVVEAPDALWVEDRLLLVLVVH